MSGVTQFKMPPMQINPVIDGGVTVSPSVLDQLMPLHLTVAPDGRISHAGPTLRKICAGSDLTGRPFLETFQVSRPTGVKAFSELYQFEHCRLRATLRTGARQDDKLSMKGLCTRLPGRGGMIANLSLGVSVVEAVARFDLSSADFAASDPTVDMLYLIEANHAALGESKRLNQRLQGAKVTAEAQASTDTLTGLKNRRALDAELIRLTQAGIEFGLMNLDLDYFKQVNDSCGHAAGDHVLEEVARILLQETRSGDLVARVGGDEFVLIFERCVDLDTLNTIAMRIIAELEIPILYCDQPCRISASIGITLSTFYDQPEADRMLSDADRALYHSKHLGRARHTVFDPDQPPKS